MPDRRNFLRHTLFGLAAVALVGLAAPGVAAGRQPFDAAAFAAATAAGGPVLVDVSAAWCSTCHRQNEIVTGLVQQAPYDAFTVFVIDYDTQKDLMRSFGASARSTLIVFRGSEEVGRLVGDTRPDAIAELLGRAV